MLTEARALKGQSVKQRQVYYVPGYDPFHPRRYRELYRKEANLQSKISDYSINLKRKKGDRVYGWHVESLIDGASTKSDIDVLVWSDIVRNSMSQDIPQTYLQLIQTAWIYLSTGALLRLMTLRKGPIIAALYPVFALIIQLLIAIWLGWSIGHLAFWLSPWLNTAVFWVVACISPIFVLRWFKKKDGKFFAYYLMHDFAHSAKDYGDFSAEMKARMKGFQKEIESSLDSDVDEVLVIGHSSGAHIAVKVLADIIRDQGNKSSLEKLCFLSLGQVVPMVSFLPKASGLRSDLHLMSEQKNVAWVDVTAPGDGCSFALCDPVDVTGVTPKTKHWPLVFSAAFTQSLSPEKWKKLRWRFFRLHFQYLCAFDRPKDYDYFKITAGPLTLKERYSERPPSKSVLSTPRSGYRGML